MLDLRLPLPKLLLPSSKSTQHPAIHPSVQPSFRLRQASILPGILIPRHLPPTYQATINHHHRRRRLGLIRCRCRRCELCIVYAWNAAHCLSFCPSIVPFFACLFSSADIPGLRPPAPRADHQPPAAGFATYTLAHRSKTLFPPVGYAINARQRS